MTESLLIAGALAVLVLVGAAWWAGHTGSVPLPEGPVLGWRAWRVDRAGNLRALASGHPLGRSVPEASCNPRLARDKHLHEVPGQRCQCGWHAVTSRRLAARAAAHTERWERRLVWLLMVLAFGLIHVGALPLLVTLVVFRQRRRRSIVYGVVALSGRIALDPVAGGVQMRAEQMLPLALVDSTAARRAGKRYGLPVIEERWIVARSAERSGASPIDPWCLGRSPLDALAALAGVALARVSSLPRLAGRPAVPEGRP